MIDLKWKRLGALDATLIAQLLKCNRSCTKLDLAWNSELCSAGSTGAIDLAEALAANRTLKELDLSETRLGDSCAPAMCRAVGNATLTKLNLRSTGLGREAREEIEAENAEIRAYAQQVMAREQALRLAREKDCLLYTSDAADE